MEKLIKPEEMIDRYTLAEHLQFADAYFEGRESHLYLYQKPFYHPSDCAPSLSNLGQLFAGAGLEAGMRIMDFAAGSCWLTRILVQLGCAVTSCDVSATALDIGKELFRKYPPIANSFCEPQFYVFNGEFLEFPDRSFDRIIVNDAFHHVPNMRAVLAEFFRILKDDGVVAMSEPGRFHSRTEASQYEMRTFNVIENDFVLEDLWQVAKAVGFEDIKICPVLREPYLTIEAYLQCTQGNIPPAIIDGLVQGTANHSIFFLNKRRWQAISQPPDPIEKIKIREEFDENFYVQHYPDVTAAIRRGEFVDGWQHYELHGRGEGRRGKP